MNTDLLLKVQERILAEPEHFYMPLFFSEFECGTAACIAGHAISVANGDEALRDTFHAVLRHRGPSIQARATKALDITKDQAERLFFHGSWTDDFYTRYEETLDQEDFKMGAQVAADRISHFIATEGRE